MSSVRSPSPGDETGFPFYGEFWQVERYYQYDKALSVASSLDEFFSPPLLLPAGTYYMCDGTADRKMCVDDDFVPTEMCVTLRTLHPVDQRIVRVKIWPHASSGFSYVENAMEVIALAATGLAL